MGTTPVRIVFHGGEGFFPVHAYITAAGQTSYDTTREREPLELEVPEGVALDLTITVTCPEWVLPRTSPELEIFHAQEPVLQQRFELVPPKAGRPPIYTPVDPTHPRLVNAAPYTPKDGGRSGFKIVVDLCFLNVTKWLARHKDGTLRQLHPDSPTENEQHGQDWRYRPYRPERGRCEFYELTAGSRLPRLWTVCHNLDQPPKHVLLFLMPKGVTHAGIGDLTGDWGDGLRRYLLSPARNEPFFLRIYNRNPEDCSWYTMVTHCGFFDQLVRSGKPVAVVLPLASTTAHGASDYGALGTVSSSRQRTPDGAPVDSDLRSLLQSLRRALAADGTLPPGMLDAAFRIAVSGFSAGAPNAVLLLERNQSAVDEFYWFDPAPNLTRAYRDKLTTWLGAKSTRRLRLIGGPYREPLLELWEQLRPEFDSTRVAAIPVPDYYRRSLVYKCAVSVPPGFPPSAQEQFWPAGSAAPPGSLSDRRNIYLGAAGETATGVELVAYEPPGSTTATSHRSATVPCTMADAIGLARYHWFKKNKLDDPEPPSKLYENGNFPSIDEFRTLVTKKVTESDGYRHQWAVVGGDGDTDRGDPTRVGSFVGHLRYCIDKGEFP